ncbi:MAG: hypothetical protein ACFFBD_03595, partial [Candidatus Hodarchaeota archaeon]
MSRLERKMIAKFSEAVRESTIKRLKLVPSGFENWRITPNSMSIADLAQHIIDADNWLFKMLETKNLHPIYGQVGQVDINQRNEFLQLI